VVVTTATTGFSLWGRWTMLSITTLCTDGLTAVTFGFRPVNASGFGDNNLSVLPGGILRLSEGSCSNYRVIEQVIAVKPLHGWVTDLADIQDGAVAEGRALATALLRKTESLIETTRQTIQANLSQSVSSRFLAQLHERFGVATHQTIDALLGGLNWPLLLEASGCGGRCLEVLENSLQHNPLNMRDVRFTGDSGIPTLRSEEVRFDLGDVADAKATILLGHVCGEALAEEFRREGHITLDVRGFRFVIAPDSFVECTDPAGRTGWLCVHTVSFSCNPIDEVVLAYLNIKHKLPEYLAMANIYDEEPGFSTKLA